MINISSRQQNFDKLEQAASIGEPPVRTGSQDTRHAPPHCHEASSRATLPNKLYCTHRCTTTAAAASLCTITSAAVPIPPVTMLHCSYQLRQRCTALHLWSSNSLLSRYVHSRTQSLLDEFPSSLLIERFILCLNI